MSRSPTETSREVREAAEAMAQRSYPVTAEAAAMRALADKLEPQQYATGIAFSYQDFRRVITALRDCAEYGGIAQGPMDHDVLAGLDGRLDRLLLTAKDGDRFILSTESAKNIVGIVREWIRSKGSLVSSTPRQTPCDGADDLQHLDGMLDDRERGA